MLWRKVSLVLLPLRGKGGRRGEGRKEERKKEGRGHSLLFVTRHVSLHVLLRTLTSKRSNHFLGMLEWQSYILKSVRDQNPFNLSVGWLVGFLTPRPVFCLMLYMGFSAQSSARLDLSGRL